MATPSEHFEIIEATIKAAEKDGLRLSFDVAWDPYDSTQITSIDLDAYEGNHWIGTIKTLEW